MRIDVKTGEMFQPAPRALRHEVDLSGDADPAAFLKSLPPQAQVRLTMPGFADGTLFSRARRLRRLGYTGRLCASGPLLPDQLHMARGAGFDVLEPDHDILSRSDAATWRMAANRYRTSHVERLKSAPW